MDANATEEPTKEKKKKQNKKGDSDNYQAKGAQKNLVYKVKAAGQTGETDKSTSPDQDPVQAEYP